MARPWLWAHVLSLEAPAVAVLWTAALSRMHGMKLSPGVLEGLALTVWIIYLLDRTLDTFGSTATELDSRHRFYLRHQVWVLGWVVPLLAGVMLWLGLWRIPSGLLVEACWLVPVIAAYLLIYSDAGMLVFRRWVSLGVPLLLVALHLLPLSSATKVFGSIFITIPALLAWSSGLRFWFLRCFRKDLAAGIIFALGCTASARFHLGANDPAHWLEVLMLTLLFTGNLFIIAQQERPAAFRRDPRWFLIGSIFLCLELGSGGFSGQYAESLQRLAALVMAGLLLHLLLWCSARERSPEAFRVMADVALLLPPLWARY